MCPENPVVQLAEVRLNPGPSLPSVSILSEVSVLALPELVDFALLGCCLPVESPTVSGLDSASVAPTSVKRVWPAGWNQPHLGGGRGIGRRRCPNYSHAVPALFVCRDKILLLFLTSMSSSAPSLLWHGAFAKVLLPLAGCSLPASPLPVRVVHELACEMLTAGLGMEHAS